MRFFCDDRRHLVCLPYSRENLHLMAEKLNIKRCWFHQDHYDIPLRRISEIRSMCTVVPSREILRIIKGERNE